MKPNFCLSISFILLVSYAQAQKASFGLTAGATFATYKASIQSVSVTSDTKTGFNAGLVMSMPISKAISFRPELKYVQKGGNLKSEGTSDKLTLNYIELPMDFVFNTGTSKGMFFAGAGPSLNMGMGGKDKWDYGGGDSGEDDVKFGSSAEDDFKSFEFGINVLAGYQFAGGFFISANYNAGLSDIDNSADSGFGDTKFHNRYFGVNVGFMFPNHKPKPAATSTN